MASTAYFAWLKAGRPYRLAQPLKDLQETLRTHGLTVYDYPNEAHLTADTPEDHTPFSATGWPVSSAFGVAHAIDIMPRNDSKAALVENAAIARRLINDKNAGHPAVEWIKYLNWTDEAGNCYHISWTPQKEIRQSSDRGHVHVSGRSDRDNARCLNYDPLVSAAQPAQKEEEMFVIAKDVPAGKYYISNMVESRPIKANVLNDAKYLASQLGFAHGPVGAEWVEGGNVRVGWTAEVFGPIRQDGLSISDTQVVQLAEKIGDMLVASPDNGLTESDKATIIEAVKQALREGAD